MKIKSILILLFSGVLSMSFTFRGCTEPSSRSLIYIIEKITWKNLGLEADGMEYNYGIAVGIGGSVYKSTGTDTIYFQSRTSGTTQNLKSVKIRSGNELILAVGNNGTIIRSSNSGDNWFVIPPLTSQNLNDVCWGYGGIHFAVGDNGTILRSSNLGLNWSVIPSGTTRKLLAVSSHSNDIEYVVAAGEKGTILRSTNFGLSWVNVSLSDTTINFYGINPAAIGISEIIPFYICGSQGKIYKSTNNGSSWVQKTSSTTNTLRSIYFTQDDSGAVTGDNGTVKMTTNGGDSWFADPYFANVTGSVTSISQMPRSSRTFTALSNNNTMFIASEDSITVIIGINNISFEVPKEFSLSQNYPNPFNPVTKFRFQITEQSDVRITVYDASGREIETVVNSQLRPGTYEADWNASKYSSGVYFYKMNAGDFSQTIKMVLVK